MSHLLLNYKIMINEPLSGLGFKSCGPVCSGGVCVIECLRDYGWIEWLLLWSSKANLKKMSFVLSYM